MENSSFLPDTPLQFAWDSTSLGLLKECPRKYELSIIRGYITRVDNVHLTFGIMYHSALEAYDHAVASGATHKQALIAATRRALMLSWANGKPWTSGDKYKNRLTLVRSVVWYLTQFGENDSLKTIILSNGRPAVELSFRFETTYQITGYDRKYMLCGHIDRLAAHEKEKWVVDRKTTKHGLGPDYFSKYSPDNQMSLYAFSGRVIYQQPTQGIIIDAALVQITQSQFQRGFAPRTEAQLDEWYRELEYWLRLAEGFARAKHWPMNDKSCGMYGGCPFRTICGKDPSVRNQWLEGLFARRTWDPLQIRGDI